MSGSFATVSFSGRACVDACVKICMLKTVFIPKFKHAHSKSAFHLSVVKTKLLAV